jgi:serine/threonine-protein kinase RIO1
MALSAVMDNDNILLLFLFVGCHFRVIASVLFDADFRAFISEDQIRRHSRRIPRCALVHMDYSSFRALYNSRNDQSFITFTGLVYKSFQYL